MKIKCLIITLISLLVFSLSSYASECIVSSLIINNEEEQEIDVVMDKEKMYLPCKFILNYFQISFKENHVEKSLSFQNATLKNNSLFINGVNQKCPAFFVKTATTGVQNEFFISAEELSKILQKDISSDPHQLLAFIKTKEDTAAQQDTNPFLIKDGATKIQAYEEITLPIQKGAISLDSVGLRSNMFSDSYSQIYKDTQSKTCSFNNNMEVTFAGKLKSGEYTVGLGTNSYEKNLFAFSGINVQYKNQYKNFDYLIGKVDAWDLDDNSVSFEVMGAQLKDHVEKNVSYQQLQGQVAPTSTVKVYINDDYEKELSTYGGYYSLKGVYYNKNVEKIKITEMLKDGTEKEVLTKKFTKEEGKKNIPKRDFILGISGLQNRLFANNGYIYQALTKKYVAGFKHHKDISDKLTFDNMILADKMLPNSENNYWGQSILGNKKYLNYNVMRNLNALEGETYMGVLTYKNNEYLNSKLYFGGSHSITKDSTTPDGLGYFLQLENNYKFNENTTLRSSVFASSPNFYMAGASGGGFMSDKVGGSIGGNTNYKNLNLSGTYSKYKSNFSNYYEGGLMDFDEYNLMARLLFKKLPNLSLKVNNKRGANGIGEINSNSYELSAEKRFKNVTARGGIRKNIYSNLYSADGYSSYKSEYSNIYTDINFPIGKRFGDLTVGHEIVEMSSDDTKNGYNSIKLSYNTPSFKGYNCNFMVGFHYAGLNKNNDLGFGITKRLKSGSAVSLNYRYSAIPCYIIDNMYIPGSMRHSVIIDFSELYGIGNKGLQAIGTNNKDKGLLQVTAFLDTNQNGIKDKGEPTVENIPIKVENDSEILITDKKGTTKLKAEEAGIHNIQIFEDELPTLLSCHNKTKPSRYIKIEDNSKTKVSFGLISTVGNINGTVTIKDEFNNTLKIEDLVVSIIDTTGREVNYTNINEDGTFSFSGLNPGKYIVSVDKELQDLYKIRPDAKSENYVVIIPPEYKDYVNIDNVNLSYKYEI